jgi:hypothetical protein
LTKVSSTKKTNKCYKPTIGLISTIKEILLFTTLKNQKYEVGEKLSKKEEEYGTKLNRRKVDVLNRIIFPSMANVTFFLECLSTYPILKDIFEKDILELLGLYQKSMKHGKSNIGMICPMYSNETFVFARFISSALNNGNFERFDSRFYLLEYMQREVTKIISEMAEDEFGEQFSSKITIQDMERAYAWVKLYATRVLQQYNESEEKKKNKLKKKKNKLNLSGINNDINKEIDRILEKEREEQIPRRPILFFPEDIIKLNKN